MNYILGSGITGLLAKIILGPKWTVIPFGRSRFFSYNPAICDNFIISDKRISEFLRDAFKLNTDITYEYKCGFSLNNGSIYKEYDKLICADWLSKIYDINYPPHILTYYQNHMSYRVYDLRVNRLYATLLASMAADLEAEAQKGVVTEIGNGYLVRNGQQIAYDKIVNTIPQSAFLELSRKKHSLNAKDVYIFHIKTKSLDFEGLNQLFIVDKQFAFYKATMVSDNRYIIYCHENIEQPGPYFMPILRSGFEIIDGTSIPQMLPTNRVVQYDTGDIKHVGSLAQWDSCMDIGSCIIKLLNISDWGRN